MPSYVFRCGSCKDEQDHDYTIGNAPRILICAHCGGVAQLVIGAGVQIAPSALETKGAHVRHTVRSDAQLFKDREAYQRMRRRGIQPDHVDGSARLEDSVGDTFDATYGTRFARLSKDPWHVTKRRIQEGLAAVEEAKMTA